MIIQPHNFKCGYCEKNFTAEWMIESHKCKQMRRAELLQTVSGQAAYDAYQTWMLCQKRVVARAESFLDSRFFNSFNKFIAWANTVGLPDHKMFIKAMVEKQISPMIWTNDEVYTIFVEFFDHKISPMDHARIAVDTILDLCEEYECNNGEIFDRVDANVVITLLRQRKLSPWILLNSKKFKNFFVNRTSEHQKIILQTLIRPEHWKEIFEKKPDIVIAVKSIIGEMGL